MSGENPAIPLHQIGGRAAIDVPSPSTWDKLTNWASENKAVVYTIGAAAVVVTAAGVIYYVSGSSSPSPAEASRTAKNKEKKKAKELRRARQAELDAQKTSLEGLEKTKSIDPLAESKIGEKMLVEWVTGSSNTDKQSRQFKNRIRGDRRRSPRDHRRHCC
jgi:import receptor subunit TOM70